MSLYTCYIFFVYVTICPFSIYNKENIDSITNNNDGDYIEIVNSSSTTENPTINIDDEILTCAIPVWLVSISGVLAVDLGAFIPNEIRLLFWVHFSWSFLFWHTLPWLIFYSLMGVTLWPSVGSVDWLSGSELIDSANQIDKWRYPVAAVNILLTWILFMDQLTKIEALAVIFEMFMRIVKKSMWLSLLFGPLFLGFGIVFAIMDVEGVEGINFLTVIGLMLGDVKYEELFNESKQRESNVVYIVAAQGFYILFVLTMGIVFINFILALTSSNVQKLWEDCENAKDQNLIGVMYSFDRLPFGRYKIFNRIQTQQPPQQQTKRRRWEYTLNIDCPPSYIPVELIQQLRELAVKNYCRHEHDPTPDGNGTVQMPPERNNIIIIPRVNNFSRKNKVFS